MAKHRGSPPQLRTALNRQIGLLLKWRVPVSAVAISRNNLRLVMSDPACSKVTSPIQLFADEAPQKGVIIGGVFVMGDPNLLDKDLDGTVPMQVVAMNRFPKVA